MDSNGIADPCLFTKESEQTILIFVDDLAIFTKDEKSAESVIKC